MNECENVYFYNTKDLKETEGIRDKCNIKYLNSALKEMFLKEQIEVKKVTLFEKGKYINKSDGFIMSLTKSYRMDNLPPFCEVRIDHNIDEHTEHIIVWVPLAWNDRFIGTGGGGTGTGGDNYIRRANNLSRGQTLPFAIMNGFSAGTTNGAGNKNNWAIDPITNKLHLDLIENWHGRSTHFMTIISKAVTEILHQRKVKYSYFHGGSGGGRQAMVQAQEYPQDYNGIWASCPAINWTKFLITGYYPNAVMNSVKHYLSYDVLEFFMNKAHDKVGGKDKFYQYLDIVDFNPFDYVGQEYKKNKKITDDDAKVMRMIFEGPIDISNNKKLCNFFRPGVKFWIKTLPLACIYFPLFFKKPKPFFLCDHYASWVIEKAKVNLDDITLEDFEKLFKQSITKFPLLGADNPDLTEFKNAGGKLIIDHGVDDPLIPVDNTINYCKEVLKVFNNDIDSVNQFLTLYITPGDGHGNCTYHGCGITERDGMGQLINWVENDIKCDQIRTVNATKDGKINKVEIRKAYKLE